MPKSTVQHLNICKFITDVFPKYSDRFIWYKKYVRMSSGFAPRTPFQRLSVLWANLPPSEKKQLCTSLLCLFCVATNSNLHNDTQKNSTAKNRQMIFCAVLFAFIFLYSSCYLLHIPYCKSHQLPGAIRQAVWENRHSELQKLPVTQHL